MPEARCWGSMVKNPLLFGRYLCYRLCIEQRTTETTLWPSTTTLNYKLPHGPSTTAWIRAPTRSTMCPWTHVNVVQGCSFYFLVLAASSTLHFLVSMPRFLSELVRFLPKASPQGLAAKALKAVLLSYASSPMTCFQLELSLLPPRWMEDVGLFVPQMAVLESEEELLAHTKPA